MGISPKVGTGLGKRGSVGVKISLSQNAANSLTLFQRPYRPRQQ